MITLISSQKGGCGKSTLATNISAELARLGKDVVLVDADEQITSTRWWSERREIEPKLSEVHSVNSRVGIDTTLLDLNKRYEHVIVDTAGRLSNEMCAAMTCADIFITPVRPSQSDLDTLPDLCKELNRARFINAKMRSFVVLTIVPTNPQSTEILDAKRFIDEFSILTPVKQLIYDRKAYRECISNGRGVTEHDNEKSAEEICNLVQEIYCG